SIFSFFISSNTIEDNFNDYVSQLLYLYLPIAPNNYVPPLAQACRSCPIQNSEFKIHNSPRPRWCELAARTPIRQFHPKVIKKTFFFALLF
ncbi:hypothetical protein, partial [Capnocytophaga bilenii]